MNWAFIAKSDLVVRVTQSLICCFSILYLTFAIFKYSSNKKVAFFVGITLAISPLQVAWPRFMFTESLTLAATCWVFAEIIRSLQAKELRIITSAIALIMATFIRLDSILLLIPLITASFLIHNPFLAIKKAIQVGLILSIPWSAWIYRNHLAGLDHLFSPLAVEQNRQASGLYSWEKTWATTVYESSAIHFPVAQLEYQNILLPQHAFSSRKEENHVKNLLAELKEYTGRPFPNHIDEEFRKIAEDRINENRLDYFILKPLLRVKSLWFNFNAGMGWPGFDDKLTAGDRIALEKSSYLSKIKLISKYPEIVFGKLIVSVWKLCLYLLIFVSLIICIKTKNKSEFDIMLLVISFILARSIFSGLLNHLEARFSVPQMPILELGAVFILASFSSKKYSV